MPRSHSLGRILHGLAAFEMLISNTAYVTVRRLQTSSVWRVSPYKFYDSVKQPTLSEMERNKQETMSLKPAAVADKNDKYLEKLSKARELSPQERARIVFGSRLAGPQRREAMASSYRDILGVKVPPRPTEPDNCCMSGCVNCVWELYREDFEDWQDRKRKAKNALIASGRMDLWPEDFGPIPTSLASDRHSAADKKEEEEEAFRNVDIGIRVFIETERRLKSRRKGAMIPPPASSSATINA